MTIPFTKIIPLTSFIKEESEAGCKPMEEHTIQHIKNTYKNQGRKKNYINSYHQLPPEVFMSDPAAAGEFKNFLISLLTYLIKEVSEAGCRPMEEQMKLGTRKIIIPHCTKNNAVIKATPILPITPTRSFYV